MLQTDSSWKTKVSHIQADTMNTHTEETSSERFDNSQPIKSELVVEFRSCAYARPATRSRLKSREVLRWHRNHLQRFKVSNDLDV